MARPLQAMFAIVVHVFQLTCTYEARKPGVKEKIVDMAFNGSGARDTKRLARKTICFSRSVELYEKVIGAFIERHHFN